MISPFLHRLKLAAQVVFKSGAPFPFNKIMPYDATGGEKLYAPYKQSAWVQRAIKKVAGPISAVDLRFTLDGQAYCGSGLETFWRCPAVGMTRQEFFEATIGWLKLAGEAFWILDDTSLAPFPNPVFDPVHHPNGGSKPKANANAFPALVVARPDRMTHLVQEGELVGWQYIDGAGRHIPLLPEQVVQTRMWNPYDDWRGLAELHSCHDAAEADYLAGKFNLNLMRSNGDQGVYVIAKNGVPTDAQRQQITDQLREKRELAQRGVFKPAFLTGDIQIEDAKIKTPDADFVANRLENRHEVFLALGVPPSMADVRAAYSIGSASDWFILIAETCIPTGEKICQSINRVLRRQTGLEVSATLDWDEHPVIQAVRRERVETAQKYWAMGVPLNVLNEYLDLELPACPDWDKGYLPFNVAPTGENAQAAPAPGKDDNFSEPLDDTIALMRQALDPVSRLHACLEEGREGTQGTSIVHAPSSKASSPSRWERYMAQRRETIKSYESRLGREIMKARAEVLGKIEQKGTKETKGSSSLSFVQKAVAGDFLFSAADWAAGLKAALRPVHQAALQRSGDQLFQEMGLKNPFAIAPEQVAKFVAERENQLSEIPEEVFDTIRSALQEGLDCGDTMAELAGRVRSAFNEFSKGRAMRIAMTETGAAYGTGRNLAMKQAGVQYQEWLSSGNAHARPAHQDANGQIVAMDEPFIVGGEALRFPSDPDGRPENVLNCHCVAVPRQTPSSKL
jgi:SPP1 gp7 family putative phage head morphogenesis protein